MSSGDSDQSSGSSGWDIHSDGYDSQESSIQSSYDSTLDPVQDTQEDQQDSTPPPQTSAPPSTLPTFVETLDSNQLSPWPSYSKEQNLSAYVRMSDISLPGSSSSMAAVPGHCPFITPSDLYR